jgi:hypothetical protein
MSDRIDLHTHSTASDGSVPPAELPALAFEAGLAAMALTDHDTVAGHKPCGSACGAVGIDFVPGIELSCNRGQPRGAMHMLGYFVSPDAPKLNAVINDLSTARHERAPLIIERLNDLDLPLTLDEVQRESGSAAIGRPHIAAAMQRKGYVDSVADAFRRYLGYGKPAYVRKDNLPTDRAIDAIHDAGGLAILAHPIQLRCADEQDLQQVVRRLVDEGLDGLEVYHSDHDEPHRAQYRALAQRLGLLRTGGSDYHGDRKPIHLGAQPVPYALLDQLREAHAAGVGR